MKSLSFVLFISINICCSINLFSQPNEKWVYTAKSQLYAPPLVADLLPENGNETIISDSEARILRCISSSGDQLWEFDGKWKKRLSSMSALTRKSSDGNPLLLIGNGDGSLTCIDAEKGKQLWKVNAGSIVWGTAIWADVDGDGIDEAIAGTDDNGIIAFSNDGKRLWSYSGGIVRPKLTLTTPISASDIDGDGTSEIFAADRIGVFCLNGNGSLKWQTQTGDEFNSAPIIADADLDGKPELYCATFEDNNLFALDALTGNQVWQFRLSNKVDIYSGSSFAVGDINGDLFKEILIGDSKGTIYCLNAKGELLWIHTIKMKTHSTISLGDVDGDGEVEVLIASGDHSLYCLDNKGLLEWNYKVDLRLIYPATIVDIENDGKTDILFCGSGGKLKCLTLNGKYDSKKIPWPSHRFNVANSGASFNAVKIQNSKIVSSKELLLFGGFEQIKIAKKDDYPSGSKNFETRIKRPRGWFSELTSDAIWTLDSLVKHSGESSVKIASKNINFKLGSEELKVSNNLKTIDVSIWSKGKTVPKAGVIWMGVNGVIRVDQLQTNNKDNSEWTYHSTNKLIPPNAAMWVKLVCNSNANSVVWWDDAQIKGNFEVDRSMKILVNQLGFEKNAKKYFNVSSNFKSGSGKFEILDESNKTVYSSTLDFHNRIKGSFGNDWGSYYWRGDFSTIKKSGNYRIRVLLDGLEETSWPFVIEENLYWNKTVQPAYKFFYYQRCGMEIPGFHKACHLDDATDEEHKQQFSLAGGWHDAGDYNKYYNAPYVLGLANAYFLQESQFTSEKKKNNGKNEFLEEILWGADFSRRMIAEDGSARGELTSGWGYFGVPDLESDNIPMTGDERTLKHQISGRNSSTHTAAMARVARITKDNKSYIEAAHRGLTWALNQKKLQGTLQLSAAIDLYAITGKKEYADISKKLFDICGLKDPIVTIAYDTVFGTNHSQSIKERLTKEADKMLSWADNPFGFYTYGPKESPNFFGTPKDQPKFAIGTNHYVLAAVEKMGYAYLYNPNPLYLEFIYNQLNWILGNNPYGISLMEGIGSSFAPTYHHRYFLTGVSRGAVPGGVINGIVWKDIGNDTPYFDMTGVDIPYYASNEFWLPHNTNYLKAIAVLQKIIQESKNK